MAQEIKAGDVVRVKDHDCRTYRWFKQDLLLVKRSPSVHYGEWVDIANLDGSHIENYKEKYRGYCWECSPMDDLVLEPLLTAVRRRRHGKTNL